MYCHVMSRGVVRMRPIFAAPPKGYIIGCAMMSKSLKARLASRQHGRRKLQTRGTSIDGRNPDGGCCIAAAKKKKTATATSRATPATSKKTQKNMVP